MQKVDITRSSLRRPSAIDAAASYDGLPCWKRSLFWICGVSEMKRVGESQPRSLVKAIGGPGAIREDGKAKWICNINAIFLAAISIFVWIFFW